jgi:hypothetical protein
MVKKSSRITLRAGDGLFDVVKSVGKAAAPALIDLAASEAKKGVSGSGAGAFQPMVSAFGGGLPQQQFVDFAGLFGGKGIPMMMSAAQIRKLKSGGAITINPSMIAENASHALMALPATLKKLMSSMKKGKGMRYSMKHGEDVVNRKTGKGLFDVLKSVGKAAAPALIDLAASEAKKGVSGSGLLDVAKSVVRAAAPRVIDMAAEQAKKSVAGGALAEGLSRGLFGNKMFGMGVRSRKKSVMMVQGAPKVTKGDGLFGSAFKALAPIAIDLASEEAKRQAGGGIYPAGRNSYGGGMMVRGKYGYGVMPGDPIQLGSPYQQAHSPAMSPYIPMRSQLSGYNPIKSGKGIDPVDLVGTIMDIALP